MPAGDITQGYIFVAAEKNIDQVKLNNIVGQAYINPAFVSAQTASTSATTGDYFLVLKSGGTLAKIVYDDLANSLGSSTGMTSAITSVRLRSYNALAFNNCNFEVNQRLPATSVTATGTSHFPCDRWWANNITSTTMAYTVQQTAGNIVVPGLNYLITQNFLRVTLTATQATLAAGDIFYFVTYVEGPVMRELVNDVSSLSILCRSSVASLKFSVSLVDNPGGTYSVALGKLATLGAGNTWALLSFPNLPLWPSGKFGLAPGLGANTGYGLIIALAAGTTPTLAANDTWQTTSTQYVASGITNFAAQAVNSTFDIAFLQHESGATVSQLMDLSFSDNLSRCGRYYQKSYPLAVKPGTAGGAAGTFNAILPVSGTNVVMPTVLSPRMAKTPTITIYNWNSGAANSVRYGGADVAVSATSATDATLGGFTTAASMTGPGGVSCDFTADTGW